MIFSVEQEGIFGLRLVWEYGRVLGQSRRQTLVGKLLFFPGAWILFMGTVFTLGMLLTLGEPLTDDEEMGMLLMVPLTVVLLLWGTSWCGLVRLPAALFRLLKLRRTEQTTRFYLSYLENARDMARTNYPYQAVLDVCEAKKAFFLQMEDGQSLILQKSCFTTGEPDAFRRWMDEKSGRPVRILKI